MRFLPTFQELGIYHYVDTENKYIVSVATEFTNPTKMYSIMNTIMKKRKQRLLLKEHLLFSTVNSYLYALKPESLLKNRLVIKRPEDFSRLSYLGLINEISAQFTANLAQPETFIYIANNKYMGANITTPYALPIAHGHIRQYLPLYLAYIYSKAFYELYINNASTKLYIDKNIRKHKQLLIL
jgi:hypothetical protein